MRYRTRVAFSVLLMSCLVAAAKDKKKFILPADVLDAKTVAVVIDPNAGMVVDAPNANPAAQQDVENALMGWGRFTLVNDVSTADLIISVRKGDGRAVQPTIGGGSTNNRPVVFDPSDSGIGIGGHRGAPQAGDPTSSQPQNPRPEVEAGSAQDMFAVYRGKRDHPLDAPAVWRYSTKDALSSPGVPAVDAFRKLIAEAEKQQAAKP
jgi:hypothetical protein